MMRFLLRVWKRLPLWFHILAARIVRPKFRVAVAAIVFNAQGHILLFRHTYRKFEWGIPAGGLEYDEQPDVAIVREFFEETALYIRVQKLLLAESSPDDHHVSLIYLCTIESGTFRESLEISEMKYFAIDDLPPMLFGEKALIRKVANMISAESL